MQTDQQSFRPLDILPILARQWLKSAIFMVFCFSTVFVGVYLWPETYESSAKILVKLGRENAAVPVGIPSSQQFVAAIGVRKEDINSEIELIRNRVIVENTVRKLGTDFLFPKQVKPAGFIKRLKYEAKLVYKGIRESIDDVLIALNIQKRLTLYQKAVLVLERNLTAKQIINSDVIDVRVKWFSPDIAATVLTSLIEQYLALHLQAHMPEGGYQVLQNQVTEFADKLVKNEDRLQHLKKSQNISSIDDQRPILLRQLATHQAALQETQTDIAENANKIKELKAQQAALYKTVTPGFNAVIKEVEKDLLQQEIRAEGLSGKANMLEKHVRSYQNDLDKLNGHDIELRRLNRQVAITEESYNLYRKKLEDAKVSKILDTERIVNVKIIEPSIASYLPIKPKKMMILGIGAVVSLILGICLALLLDTLANAAAPAGQEQPEPVLPGSAPSPENEMR